MASELIQFRLSGQELEALKALAGEESINLYTQRIIKGILSTKLSTLPSTPAIETKIASIVEAKLSENDILNRLQEVERQVGESLA